MPSSPIQLPYRMICSGYCTSSEAVIFPGASRKKIRIPALCTLLEHPEHGPILYDTGYHTRVYDVSKKHWASRLYMKLIPVFVEEKDHVASQLPQLGYQPEEVKHVIISHFHPDHIPGLGDFPNATFHYLPDAWAPLRDRTPLNAIRKGFFPGLEPADLEERTAPFLFPGPNPAPLDLLEPGIDLFGDGSIRGIPLPGHAAGQMGLAFTDTGGRLTLLCTDACWFSRSLREEVMPSRLADWILEDADAFRDTFQKLCRLHQTHPEVRILPAHCLEVWEEFRQPDDHK